MLYPLEDLEIINKALQKAEGKITRAEAKKVHKDLPPGGVWRTIRGHHVYIVNGKVAAGSLPWVNKKGEVKAKKATKAHLKEYQAHIDKEAGKTNEEKPKKTTKKKTATKEATTKKTAAKVTEKPKKAAAEKKAAPKEKLTVVLNKNATLMHEANGVTKMYTAKHRELPSILQNHDQIEVVYQYGQAKRRQKQLEDMGYRLKDTIYYNNDAPYDRIKQIWERKKDEPKTTTKTATKTKKTTATKTTKTTKTTTKKTATKKESQSKETKAAKKDIRTEAQKNREIAYDVGEKIGGARKDVTQKRFIAAPSLANLAELEKISPKLAYKLVNKQNLLPKMNEDYIRGQYQQGVDLKSTLMKQLIYGRIDTRPEDSPEARQKYMSAIRKVQDIFEPIKDFETLKRTMYSMSYLLAWGDSAHEQAQKDYEIAKKNLKKPVGEPPGYWDESRHGKYADYMKDIRKQRLAEAENKLKIAKEGAGYDFKALGDSFYKLFRDSKSSDSAFRTLEKKLREKGDTWDTFLSAEQKEALGQKKERKNRQEQWKREIPKIIKREGGRKTPVKKPEDMMKHFGFRGVEFGHWVDDTSGKVHLQKASEAFHDLADTLGLTDKDVSFNGKLAMAFGARGKGGALAHYEPEKKVINLTKEGGSGSLAHEWGHALDNLLWEHSHGFEKGKYGFASNGDYGSKIDKGVAEAYKNVMKAIKEGDHVEEIDRDGHAYTTTSELIHHYNKANGDLGKAVKSYMQAIRDRYADSWNRKADLYRTFYRTNEKELAKAYKKHERDLQKVLKMAPQAMAHYHEKQTGQKVEKIQVPTGKSHFLADAEARDGNRHYWRSNEELFARAFEAYVQDELERNKRRNDYLVCGTKPQTGFKGTTRAKKSETAIATMFGGYPYPQGEERQKINNAMRYLMQKIRESKSITKALALQELIERIS